MSVKRNNWYWLLPIVLLSLASCHKKNQQIDYNAGIAATQQYTSAQQMMDLLLNTYFKSITDSILLTDFSNHIDGAAVYYKENPDQIIIKYPFFSVSDGYGHMRSGRIIASAPQGFYDSLVVISFTFEHFSYDRDSIFVSGMTLENMGRANGLDKTYKINAGSITRLFSDTTGFTFSMGETFTWQKDASSVFHTPNERFKISGAINGALSVDDNYYVQIDEAKFVLNELSCPYAKQGPAVITFDKEDYTVNIHFNPVDSCENIYQVNIDDYLYYLPYK